MIRSHRHLAQLSRPPPAPVIRPPSPPPAAPPAGYSLSRHLSQVVEIAGRSTDRLCHRGASVKNLAHSASLHAGENNAPSKPGTKHLVHYRRRVRVKVRRGRPVEERSQWNQSRTHARLAHSSHMWQEEPLNEVRWSTTGRRCHWICSADVQRCGHFHTSREATGSRSRRGSRGSHWG